MSQKASARRKGRPSKQCNDADTSLEILRNIHSSSHVSGDDISRLYMLYKPVCQDCRVNSKNNPNCFCGLIPPPNGTRKSGLWQKLSDFVSSLGEDVCGKLRELSASPAGLTNLGATCYANSILQCLFMNKDFRRGVFSAEVDVLGNCPVLDQLVRLFAQLQGSRLAVIDSDMFIKTLELDNSIQQDSHEFLTLFLSLLENSLSHSRVATARTIVRDLFCGSMSHVTRCSSCGNYSVASSSVEDFYDLELNINGFKTLDESLDDYLSIEELCGENQYFCDACYTRVNATRQIKLRKLPNILTFQLRRCIFLPKTTAKKKITSQFSFPRELNMDGRIPEYQSDTMYDLSAVLIHKGMGANSGHYIAHIKDECTGCWWEFDDEHVSDLGHHLLEEEPSNLASKSRDGSFVQTYTGERDYISSSDAYMLMYRRRYTHSGDLNVHTQSDGTDIALPTDASSMDSIFSPPYLEAEINNQNAVYGEACEDYKLRKEKALELLTSRRQEVQSVLSIAPVSSTEESFFWIYTDWLSHWADNLSALPIDNTHIQCSHGKLPAEKVGSIKRLSPIAWTMLFSKYGGGPVLTNNDYCMYCLLDSAKTLVLTDTYKDRRAIMRELAEAALLGHYQDGPLYFVSKLWLQQWLRRKNADCPREADACPTASLRCPHGGLVPEQATGSRRVLVPEVLWHFFCEDASVVYPENSLDRYNFSSRTEPCTRCSMELANAAYHEDTLREMKLRQRQYHEKLAVGKPVSVSLDCRYYLLPSSWLSKWRNFINSGAKSSESPETLDHIINLLKCQKHSLLTERPLGLINKRGMIFQSISAMACH